MSWVEPHLMVGGLSPAKKNIYYYKYIQGHPKNMCVCVCVYILFFS